MSAGAAVKTTCPYCGVGCGVIAQADGAEFAKISGDETHPANFGRLCSKGSALGETLALNDRLLYPIISGVRASWDEALDLVAGKFQETIAQHGPESVAIYGSGQLLTEDYYVANKLMKGFIGSGNMDTNSRLCMASSVAGHKRAFGSDTVPGCYEDLELADLVVLVGSNLAWCHPVIFQRLAAAKEKRPELKVVVIDPRRTATSELADLHLSIAPGADVALFNGLLAHLEYEGLRDAAYVEDFTTGIDAAFACLGEGQSGRATQISEQTGLSQSEIEAFYDLFAAREKVVTVYSQGVNQSTRGTDKVNAIINCHLLTGRIGRPGMGPFSVTGQPNAMGGREVGGLSNQLAAHMDFGNEQHHDIVSRFWKSSNVAKKPGYKAVDLYKAVADGRVKALWIMATNPVDSLPEANAVRKAIESCPFVAVSDVVRNTDTTAVADVLLPAAGWGEKDGTVTNSERRISRQRAFLPLPGEAKPDWWIVSQVAQRLGFQDAFDYQAPHEIFKEHAQLSAFENNGARDFDLSGLCDLDEEGYADLEPVQWPVPKNFDEASDSERVRELQSPSPDRFFSDGNFFHSDRKARFVATPFVSSESKLSEARPLVLNTGRVRDQWHTMTRTAKTSRLMSHIGEPYVEIHPDDAQKYGVEGANLAAVESDYGSVVVRVLETDRQRHGSVFVPMHWTDQVASNARIDSVVAANTDAVSGQPESKFTPVSIKRFAACWYGFAVLASKPQDLQADYWAMARAGEGWAAELAGLSPCEDWACYANDLFGTRQGLAESDRKALSTNVLSYHDKATGQNRFLAFEDDRLVGALFVSSQPVAVSRSWAASLLSQSFSEPAARLSLLAGRPGADQPDPGAIVCSCFSVGVKQITAALTSADCNTVDDVGGCLGAGTNCGSCRSEIGRMINELNAAKAS